MSQSPIHQLVYVSAATQLFGSTELLDLLAKARENNQRLGVTGLLLYKDGDFIQLLEGDKDTVQSLYRQISADPRHRSTIVMFEGESDTRLFGDWSMGFRNLADPDVQATPGFSRFMNTPLIAKSFAEHPNDCLKLLALFKPGF